MDFLDLRYLTTCAKLGNLTRAAQMLGLHTSTMSRRIGRLEDELGLSLFERSHTGIRLTSGAAAIVIHARRALAEIEAIKSAGARNGTGSIGQIRLGVRVPPIGGPIQHLLSNWKRSHPQIQVIIVEPREHEIAAALKDRSIDIALLPSFMLWPHAATVPLYHEGLFAALPSAHPLSKGETLSWAELLGEIILVQGWNESQLQREFFASLLGSGSRFEAHPASKLSVFALVGAGYGITLAAKSQAEVNFPGLVFRPITEPNASFRVDLAWMPEMEEPVVGRFVAFMRDEARSRGLV